jgi:hypothetical protein
MKERYGVLLERSAVLINPSVAPFPPRIPASSQRENTVASAPPITCPQCIEPRPMAIELAKRAMARFP